ncbi:NAD(P)-binding domain-containing protein [Arcanobacterium bovis]|uniref:NAD(P)/FAD-dependent oxidoreductase n=1 Tax=Arcanobacterium bovis TaxID=2529275 RepID=A0A4Q9V0T0_9ACTO|nr:NAD(P)-binding domain-containing protein [Arcanobacterium bovis]TBW21076.1 NAD(P)/FAD-dependent oxidoreductase [Arcanobacterium bovis]
MHDSANYHDFTPSAHKNEHYADVVVIGGGQAGLCSAYELLRRGFVGYAGDRRRPENADNGAAYVCGDQGDSENLAGKNGPGAGTFVVLDGEVGPGGAWRHRWRSLTMSTINHIADLPGMPVGEIDPAAPSSLFVSQYFADYEHEFDLPILHLVRVVAVEDVPETGLLRVRTTAGTWYARRVINCTGTWTRPFVPHYEGAELFRGQQFHTQNYPRADRFWGKRVMIVGGGISALTHLDEVSREAKKTIWVTRTPPRWREDDFSPMNSLSIEAGRAVEQRVRERVEVGLMPLPVVAETGLPENDMVRDMRARGVLKRREMFDRLDKHGAWWGEKFVQVDAIIWATGFRAELRHLAPLKLRSERGGVQMRGTRAVRDERVHLLGYGPSASTIGARRDARVAVREIAQELSESGS